MGSERTTGNMSVAHPVHGYPCYAVGDAFIPAIACGTGDFKVQSQVMANSVRFETFSLILNILRSEALKVGFRFIDSARAYMHEKAIGKRFSCFHRLA
jgi:diketogulonate reductase-like aldo/keto reductase